MTINKKKCEDYETYVKIYSVWVAPSLSTVFSKTYSCSCGGSGARLDPYWDSDKDVACKLKKADFSRWSFKVQIHFHLAFQLPWALYNIFQIIIQFAKIDCNMKQSIKLT